MNFSSFDPGPVTTTSIPKGFGSAREMPADRRRCTTASVAQNQTRGINLFCQHQSDKEEDELAEETDPKSGGQMTFWIEDLIKPACFVKCRTATPGKLLFLRQLPVHTVLDQKTQQRRSDGAQEDRDEKQNHSRKVSITSNVFRNIAHDKCRRVMGPAPGGIQLAYFWQEQTEA